MSHSALNMHYVNGVPANKSMPTSLELLAGNKEINLTTKRVFDHYKKKRRSNVIFKGEMLEIFAETAITTTNDTDQRLQLHQLNADQEQNKTFYQSYVV